MTITTLAHAKATAGSLGYPSKMPGTSYGIPAAACKVGRKLALVAGSTCSMCYALKNNYTYSSVKKAQAKRLAGLSNPAWVDAMVYMLRRAHGLDGHKRARQLREAGHHRWHDSGDLQDAAHLDAICEVARRTPELQHWLPTREIGMVTTYAKANPIPANLLIRVSATMVDGAATKAWPHVSLVHKGATPRGTVCPAPAQGNQCGSCRACWSHDVAAVSYHAH